MARSRVLVMALGCVPQAHSMLRKDSCCEDDPTTPAANPGQPKSDATSPPGGGVTSPPQSTKKCTAKDSRDKGAANTASMEAAKNKATTDGELDCQKLKGEEKWWFKANAQVDGKNCDALTDLSKCGDSCCEKVACEHQNPFNCTPEKPMPKAMCNEPKATCTTANCCEETSKLGDTKVCKDVSAYTGKGVPEMKTLCKELATESLKIASDNIGVPVVFDDTSVKAHDDAMCAADRTGQPFAGFLGSEAGIKGSAAKTGAFCYHTCCHQYDGNALLAGYKVSEGITSKAGNVDLAKCKALYTLCQKDPSKTATMKAGDGKCTNNVNANEDLCTNVYGNCCHET